MSTYFQGLKDRFSITASNLPEGVKTRLLEDKPELEWPLDLVRGLDQLEDTYLIRDIHDTDTEFVAHLIEFLKEAEFQIQEELAGCRDLHSYMLVNNSPKEPEVKADTLSSKEEYEQAPLGTLVRDLDGGKPDGTGTWMKYEEGWSQLLMGDRGHLTDSVFYGAEREVIRRGAPTYLTTVLEFESAPEGTQVEFVGCPGYIWEKNLSQWESSTGDTVPFLSPRERRVIRWGKNLNTTTTSF